jgi:acyl-CoA reductase-like NAD-dependent aldehyde dehydrogenase
VTPRVASAASERPASNRGQTALIIGGSFADGAGPEFASINPASGEINAMIAAAGPEQIDEAFARAGHALSGPWRSLLPHRRARLLGLIADGIERNAAQLAELQTRENGKTLAESRAQAGAAAEIFRYYAGVCETQEAELTPPRGDYVSMTVYEPVGRVLAITPWNSPLTLTAQKIAPALAAGNAVVVKPSEVTTLTVLELGRIVVETGLPDGTLSVLAGDAAVGKTLVEHAAVDFISFTGGTEGGRAVAEAAARRLVPVILELGGKSPNIVCADADIEAAVAGLIYGIFHSTGQSCIAGSRILVERSMHDLLLARLIERTDRLKLGEPLDPSTSLGPCASLRHRDRIQGLVEHAIAEGARVATGGTLPRDPALGRGAYYPPTILTDVTSRMVIAREEVFGPVAVVIPFDSEDDLVAIANDTPFGLACGIWTADFPRAWRIARAVRAGTVWVNTYKQLSVANPFGGVGQSGIGREKGPSGLRAYQLAKSLYFDLSGAPIAWPAGSKTGGSR